MASVERYPRFEGAFVPKFDSSRVYHCRYRQIRLLKGQRDADNRKDCRRQHQSQIYHQVYHQVYRGASCNPFEESSIVASAPWIPGSRIDARA